MKITVDELIAFAKLHDADDWKTGPRELPFSYCVTPSGIKYTPGGGSPRPVPLNELESFCEEFNSIQSFSPGKFPDRWHKSYTLPLIRATLKSNGTVV
jgi:hypothetical protein